MGAHQPPGGYTKTSGVPVQFIAEPDSQYIDRLVAEVKAGRGTISATGALHGTFPILVADNVVRDMTPSSSSSTG